MKREDLIIVILGLLLLAGMLITIFFGGEKSRHGVGNIPGADQGVKSALTPFPDEPGGVGKVRRAEEVWILRKKKVYGLKRLAIA